MKANYSVVVGNIGTVYSGGDWDKANATYLAYEKISEELSGRGAGEDVTLFMGDEPRREHTGWLDGVEYFNND